MRRSSPTHIQRILLILPEFPPSIGGMQTHAIYLSHYLVDRGYSIEAVTYQPTDSTSLEEINWYDNHFRFPVHRILSRLGFWYNLDLLSQIAQRFQPDIIYASTVFYGLLRERLAVPIVCRSVGNDLLRPWIAYPYRLGSRIISNPRVEKIIHTWSKKVSSPGWIESILHRKRLSLMKESARKISRILANSKFTTNLLENLGIPCERIDTVIGGVNSEQFRKPQLNVRELRRNLELPEDKFNLITACRLVEKKGINFLLHAFKEIRGIIPNAHLVIVGDGKNRRKYEKLSSNLNLEENVTFTGRISHKIIHYYYWCCDLFVLASQMYYNPRAGIKDAETMGRVLCEANATGIPVIASRSGGIPSVITHEENGLLFEENNLDDFLKQVKRIKRDETLVQNLIQDGLKKAKEKFDWLVILQHHEEIFAKLLNTNEPVNQ